MTPIYIHLGDDWDLEISTTPRKNINIDLTWAPIFTDSDVIYHIAKCGAATARRIAAACDPLLAACEKAEPYKVVLKTDGRDIAYLCPWAQRLPALFVSDTDLQIEIPLIANDSIRMLQDALRDAAEELA